jgi:Tfp pilus assembly protein PilO
MGARNVDRIWLFAGVVVIILLTVASWFLFIGPKYSQAADVRVQVDDTQTQLITLRKKIAELEKQKAELPKFKAALRINQQALPSDSGVPDFLRQLQAAGDKVGVIVSAVSVAAPAKTDSTPGVWEIAITLTAGGSAGKLSLFLNQLQNVQPRAVLVASADLAPGTAATPGGAPASDASLNLTLTAYVAPPVGAGTPIVTTK